VSIPKDLDFIGECAVFYSLIPWFVVIVNVLEVLCRRGTKQLSFLLFVGVITVVNEFVVKQLVAEPRPGANGLLVDGRGVSVGSCSVKCGMPSSHCTMSVGFLMLVLFDGVYRVVPSKASLSFGVESTSDNEFSIKKWMSTTPLAPCMTMTHREFLGFLIFWSALLAPVPLSRIKLYDHSVNQVAIGCVLGLVYAFSWFVMTMYVVRKCVHHSGEHFGPCKLFVHDYHPPEFRVRNSRGEVQQGVRIAAARDSDLRHHTIKFDRKTTSRVPISNLEMTDNVKYRDDPVDRK
jgi:hypothetical protein